MLAPARHRELRSVHLWIERCDPVLSRIVERGLHAGKNVVVRDGAVRVHLEGCLDDLACPRIYERLADRETGLTAVNPLNDRIAHVQRVYAVRKVLDPDGIPEAGRLESCI